MSASPSGQSNNGTPTPNGGKPVFKRRSQTSDPLRQHKPRPTKGAVQARPVAKPPGGAPNGVGGPKSHGLQPVGLSRKPPLKPIAEMPRASANGVAATRTASAWSSVPENGSYQDFPLYSANKALRDGLKYHVARFLSKKDVDPTDQDEWPRPVSLHRRDPRQPPPGKMVKDEDPANNMPVDSKEQERLELASLEKEAQKAADLAQIAPSGTSSNPAAKKKPHGRGEKIVQFYGGGKSEEKERESKIRYEEALPWHMEDAENKHTFVGNYEAALSYSQVIFIIEGSSFKMIPLEKWYKMTAKNQFKTLTIEEAEAQMSKKSQVPRWHMKAEEEEQKIKQERLGQNEIRGLFTVKKESHTSKRTAKTELQDADDLDFEGNEFQDDEEHQTVEPERDEESKETESRLKREYLTANLFGDADEYEVDKEEEQEEKVKEVSKALGKKTKKALKNREKNYLYDSDSDKDPYATDTSGDEDSDEEERKAEEEKRRKEEEEKLKAKAGQKPESGASSKGTNTPLGRPKGALNKKPNHLKRPGSPDLSASEMSGNESARKKMKKKHVSSSQPTGTSTPSGSRAMSPSASQPTPGGHQRRSSIVTLPVESSKLSQILSSTPHPSAVASDGEATAGETSDGAPKKKKLGLKIGGGARLSPSGSRAGSPAAGSRAGSPAAAPAEAQSPAAAAEVRLVTREEVMAALRPEGITIGELLGKFTGRVNGGKPKEHFMQLVKNLAAFGADKKLRPKK